MSNWDDEDWEEETPSYTPAQSSEVVPGNWDDEDASEEEPEPEPEPVINKPTLPLKPSKLRKLKEKMIKEKEEKEKEEEVARIKEREKELSELDAVQRKLRQQQIIEEADMEHTKDLFMDRNGNAANSIDNFVPKSDEDFKELANRIGEKCCELNDNPKKSRRYVDFVKDLLRAITKDLGPDDTNDLSTFVGLLSNEKRDEQKKSRGIKKKGKLASTKSNTQFAGRSKPNLRVDRDDAVYDDKYDDFADDFM